MRKKHFILLLILLVFATVNGFSQSDLLSKKVSVNVKNEQLSVVLENINEKYNINFSFSNDLITEDIKVTLKAKNKPLKTVLKKLLNDKQIEFLVVENHVIIKKKKIEENSTSKNKKHTISGYIKDKETGELMIGATVYVKELVAGTITNAYGFYSITLPGGSYTLVYSFIGFNDVVIPIELNKNLKLDYGLNLNNEFLSEVIVEAEDDDEYLSNTQMSEIKMNSKSFQQIPSFMGETEVVKSLQLLPGIKSYGDGSTFFYVRGGERDHNLILIDEAPIYNPTHLLGFFSSFVPEAIKDVKIYKGDFPAMYGGRLSSLIDIKTKDGNKYKFGGNAGLGLFMSRFSLEGPIIKEKSSYFISFRKSNLKWLFSENPNQSLYFYDLNFKFNFKLGSKDRLFFSGYSGKDNFSNTGLGERNFGINWKNTATTLRWNHLFNDKLFSNTTLTASNYNYFLVISEKNNYYWNSKIANLCLKSDFTYYQTPELTIRFGMSITAHNFIPGKLELGDNQFRSSYPVISPKNASETALYMTNEQKLNDKVIISYGGRLTSWSNIGEATEYTFNEKYSPIDTIIYEKGERYHKYVNFEPRLSINYLLNSVSSVKAGYHKTCQYLQLLSNSISPFTSLEVWLPSGPSIKPQKAHQFSLGYYRKVKKHNIDISVESFYKSMKNQIDYKDHANMLLNPLVEGELRFGKAWSYGIEFMAKRDFGKLSGRISYTYSRVLRKIKDVNNDNVYPAFQDRPHDISFNFSYKLSKAWLLAANWVYSTGSAISVPTAFYYYNGYSLPVYGEKNNGRLPDYHRLDLLVKLNLNPNHKGSFRHDISFTLYNAYWRKNYISLNYNQTELSDGSFIVPGNLLNPSEYVPTSIYLLGAIPSITYNIVF